ncbi:MULTISPECIES: alpha/beta fold hydrolase [Serratia]|uniref:3-oxoadipate enol-lactonase 2 n=1 Tax=Serratia ficaria TaxID=61651 RepID=A0A240B3P4_SERFI|nr:MULTISPECIES: alpha/beta hydrolase [Serratia]REF46176.1 pimeloyl-ACP methyl ester carboxylesterase [Serratia ficaria]CAI0871184.1 3-oxoadipate enol-lactonase 2 [Serratia ficaria]CAI0947749.1 3-oxoadipate enol-lactonase 2 [Serratia ficaria]CAI1002209.1 3-oxoadipate enol-lactonase 2 [Serratia ficaria]CAI1015692.1 3-oxoadipate enol-lactonase 2 [Serratia ficaria]
MPIEDTDLNLFQATGAPPLPPAAVAGRLEHEGARIWYATCGDGPPVFLLHGGLGHSGNWGYQVPALVNAGYRAVLIDSRGHGRSSRDRRPYSYELMAGDALAVMDRLALEQGYFVGWSDGACTALTLAATQPSRTAGVFFFACNMDPTGAREMQPAPRIDRCFARHRQDYAALSATPDGFEDFVAAVTEMMRTQPNYSADDLRAIAVPVDIVLGEQDEFIKRDHAVYLASNIPGATLTILPGVSHFAPLQRPALFNQAVLSFLDRLTATR